jgi:hypothetical protein
LHIYRKIEVSTLLLKTPRGQSRITLVLARDDGPVRPY